MPWLELCSKSADGSVMITTFQLTKIRDASTYNPSVANKDITMFRKMEFVNKSETVKGPFVCTMLSTPLNARKNAAICPTRSCK